MISFIIFLFIVYWIRFTFMNLTSLVLVLWLFGLYLTKGLEALLKRWSIFQVYQAIVLMSVLICQFFVQTKENGVPYNDLTDYWEKSLTEHQRAIFLCVGFYPFSGQMWIGLLPYVALYFFSIIVESRFKMKLTSEMGSLSQKEEEIIIN